VPGCRTRPGRQPRTGAPPDGDDGGTCAPNRCHARPPPSTAAHPARRHRRSTPRRPRRPRRRRRCRPRRTPTRHRCRHRRDPVPAPPPTSLSDLPGSTLAPTPAGGRDACADPTRCSRPRSRPGAADRPRSAPTRSPSPRPRDRPRPPGDQLVGADDVPARPPTRASATPRRPGGHHGIGAAPNAPPAPATARSCLPDQPSGRPSTAPHQPSTSPPDTGPGPHGSGGQGRHRRPGPATPRRAGRTAAPSLGSLRRWVGSNDEHRRAANAPERDQDCAQRPRNPSDDDQRPGHPAAGGPWTGRGVPAGARSVGDRIRTGGRCAREARTGPGQRRFPLPTGGDAQPGDSRPQPRDQDRTPDPARRAGLGWGVAIASL